MFNIYQNPWGLLTAAFVSLIIVLIIRMFSQKFRRMWVVPIILAIAAFSIDYLIETELEKINTVIATCVKAAEKENPELIESCIAEGYTDSCHKNKTSLMYYLRSVLVPPLIEKIIKRNLSADITPPAANVVFTVRIVFDKDSFVYQSFSSIMFIQMKINLKKEGSKWIINQAEILELDRQPVNWHDIKSY